MFDECNVSVLLKTNVYQLQINQVIHTFLENDKSDIGVDGRVEENRTDYVGS
jgi:hypothetical protein